MHSDSALLYKVRLGDEEALGLLYEEHSTSVYSVAFQILHDLSPAEDVLQDVFLKIWRAQAISIEVRNTGKWLKAISRNRAIDILRKKHLFASIEASLELPSGRCLDEVEQILLMKQVRVLMRQIPATQRQPLEMAFLQEMSHTEIARQLQIPLGTIKTRIRAAVRALAASVRRTV